MKTEETTLDKMRSRPRFKMYTSLSSHYYSQQLTNFLNKNEANFSGNINREAATICVKTQHNEYWKPYLTLRTESEENKTVIRGTFGPSSAVWTFFMFLYFIFGILWMVFITLWFVGKQIKVENYNWALPVSFAMLVMLIIIYLAARLGQQKGKEEMEKLRKFAIDSTLKFENTGF